MYYIYIYIYIERERERERERGVIAATSNYHNLYLSHRQLGLHDTLKVSTFNFKIQIHCA